MDGYSGAGRQLRATFRPNVVEIVIFKFVFEPKTFVSKKFEVFLSDTSSWVPNPQRFIGFSLEESNL